MVVEQSMSSTAGTPEPERLLLDQIAARELGPHLVAIAGRQTVCGLVVSDRPNISRDEYDDLKAILATQPWLGAGF